MGLRLVGLLPCAVWTPKVPKPSIIGQARAQTAPYPPVQSSSAVVAGTSNNNNSTTSILPLPIARLISNNNSNNSNTAQCRCSSAQISQQTQPLQQHQQQQQQQVTTNRPSSTITSSTVISTVAQATQSIRQLAPSRVRPATTSTSTNPMLLVPFAAVPGFVPVQGQQSATTALTRPPIPSHAHHHPHMQAPSPMQPSGTIIPHHHSQVGQQSQGQQTAPVIIAPASCNSGNKVSCLLLVSFLK